ncbi:MAG: UDP-3-O-[3-hydroxymyristoyl] N-acetylglucosamine deacetylase [Candidatus Dadabacteria bacterium]|nr:MAG: UDP-3-O-[3-hydroxymyristoyl] N-acetylglucosamine deacetylase [Candidatus Dadabacteria bacterium]
MKRDSRTVLIVDDEANVRDSVQGVLRDEGFEVATACDGRSALELLERSPHPALVLLDVWMPDMDGIEVLERIKSRWPRVPVVVISGHANVEMAVKATRLGACDFIEKPFSIEGLLSSVRRALGLPVGGTSEGASTSATRSGKRGRAKGPTVRQRTLKRSVVGRGLGLHSGVRTGLILHPLPPDSGIRFGRVGSEDYVPAVVDYVDSTGYATTLYKDGLVARTVEHLMAALHAYGITNLLVKVEGEVPILDGSAAELCDLIESAGIEEQEAEVPVLVVDRPVEVRADRGAFIRIEPYEGFRVRYELRYPEPVGAQTYCFEMRGPEAFREEIAPARTFGFVEEIRALESAGLGQGGQLGNFILIGDQGIVNTDLRFPEELARHKILDLIGDTYLLGRPLRGSIVAHKTGHTQNVALVRALRDTYGG